MLLLFGLSAVLALRFQSLGPRPLPLACPELREGPLPSPFAARIDYGVIRSRSLRCISRGVKRGTRGTS